MGLYNNRKMDQWYEIGRSETELCIHENFISNKGAPQIGRGQALLGKLALHMKKIHA